VSLNYLPEHIPAFERALEIAEREARALEASWHGLKQMDLGIEQLDQLAPDTGLAIGIEAFAARFGRLQDHLGEKLVPRLLLLLGEEPGPLLDNLNRAERLGILENALDWLAWRKLRNRLVHEYFQETASFAQAIQQALHATPFLLNLLKAIRQRAQQVQVPI
jgi:uncharacterized protein with HEPN domain